MLVCAFNTKVIKKHLILNGTRLYGCMDVPGRVYTHTPLKRCPPQYTPAPRHTQRDPDTHVHTYKGTEYQAQHCRGNCLVWWDGPLRGPCKGWWHQRSCWKVTAGTEDISGNVLSTVPEARASMDNYFLIREMKIITTDPAVNSKPEQLGSYPKKQTRTLSL